MILGFIASSYVKSDKLGERWLIASIFTIQPALMILVAILVLSKMDATKQKAALGNGRAYLLRCDDLREDVYAKGVEAERIQLFQAIRRGIAGYFNVPVNKVHRDVALNRQLKLQDMHESFQHVFIPSVLNDLQIKTKPFGLFLARISTIDELATAFEQGIHQFEITGEDPYGTAPAELQPAVQSISGGWSISSGWTTRSELL